MSQAQNKHYELAFFDVAPAKDYEPHAVSYYEQVYRVIHQHAPILFTQPIQVIELGCGAGNMGKRFVSWNSAASVIGVDIAPAMVNHVRSMGINRYQGILGDIEDSKLFPGSQFDFVLCPAVLHHFPDPRRVIRNAIHWLRPGGHLLLAEPNGSSPVNILSKAIRHLLENLISKEYVLKHFATPNETDHSQHLYHNLFISANLMLIFSTTFQAEAPPHAGRSFIATTKEILYKLTAFLPKPWNGSDMIMIFKKPPLTDN